MINTKTFDHLVCDKCGKNPRDLYGAVKYDWLCWDCLREEANVSRQKKKDESMASKKEIRDSLLHALFTLSLLEKDAIIYTLNTVPNTTWAEAKEVYDDIYDTLTYGM